MEQIFQLQAAFGISVAIFEVPSGYLCDLFGRKKAIILGAFFTGLGFTVLIYAKTFELLLLHEVILGLGLSMVSGADFAILYDSLKMTGDDRDEQSKAVANIQFSKVLAESIGSILGGLLVKISYFAVLLANAIVGWIPFLVAFSIVEPPIERMEKSNHWSNFKMIFNKIFREERLLMLIFMNLIMWGLSTFIAVWIFQKHWLESNIPIVYFGFLWAGYNLTVGLVGKSVQPIEKKWGAVILLLVLGALPIAGYLGLAFFYGMVGSALWILFPNGERN